MTDPSGERFVPESMAGELIEAEHMVRYRFAARLADGRRVLDAGCGVGWGSVLLQAAGASTIHGLDIDPGAVADARRRTPSGTFEIGDLAAMPFDDGCFDLVVCFEALEHVEAQSAVLDELTRVLAPGGLLLVSSPNPRVYPPGNPFHVHELVPEELLDEVQRRLPNAVLLHQYSQIASVLAEPGTLDETMMRLDGGFVASPVAGHDPYSMCLAGRGDLPPIEPIVWFAPSEQLVHLEAASRQLEADREAMNADHERVVAERELVMAERADLLRRLVEADGALRAMQHELDELRPRSERLAHLESMWLAERERLRRDREAASWMLLEAEQQLAAALADPPVRSLPTDDLELLNLRLVVDNLRHELDMVRASTSWRVTAPLRRVSSLRHRRGR